MMRILVCAVFTVLMQTSIVRAGEELKRAPAPAIEYKGRTIVGSNYDGINNDLYFDTVKKAIDMIETLPPDLRKAVSSIRRVFYNPPSPQRQRNDAYTNIVGVYTIGPKFEEPAPIIFYKDMKYSAPYEVAMSIVGNSMYAEDHQRMIELRRQMGMMRAAGDTSSDKYKTLEKEHANLQAVLDKTDQKLLNADYCRGLKRSFDVLKAWKVRTDEQDAIGRRMSARGCNNLKT